MASLDPVKFESNVSALTITGANASAVEFPLNRDGQNVDVDYTITAKVVWTSNVSDPFTSLILGFVADWKVKGILQNLETGAALVRDATVGFAPAGGNLEVVFSAIPPGTYRLYATNHLKLKDSLPFGGGAHLGVSMVSEGAMFEVFDTVLA